MIYPHEMWAMLHADFPEAFGRCMGASPAALVKFWTSFLKTRYGRHLLICIPSLRGKTPQDLRCTVPLIIHGDAVPYAKKQSAMFGQWGSLLGPNIVSAKLRVSKVGPT